MSELTPVTREEMYLDEIADALENGGGGGGAAVYNATITIQKNGTKVDDFTANQRTDKTINITVPTQASDINAATATQGGKADTAIQGIKVNSSTVNPDSNKVVNITVPTSAADVSALPNTTKYAAALSLTINSSTFVMTGQLKDQNGDNLGRAQTIDLPLESVVVNGSYDSQTKKVVLTLQNGNTIEFSVADLVSGLQTELSASNKLNPAYINYDSTHRAVSDTEKSTWNGKQSALTTEQLAAVNSGITSADVAQITTNKNNISTANAELIELVDNGAKNLAVIEDSSGTRWLDKPLLLSAGTYRLYFGSLTGDATGTTCQVVFMNGSTILDESYCYPVRGNSTSAQFILNSECTSIRIYAGGSYSESVDKTISFTNIMVCSKAAWDVSQKYVPYAPTNAELYEMIKALQS